ncbi:Magnesium chelatase [Methanocaldococcus villosus KIN24-T80]|uniref:Magnesium chelatase n=1 Tax=Methanocaldococcus villosus KIN24-T80 TaxID=1069083 RepID=N6VPR2_9EURY|nr:VWA domain-containing protein [Methanocaldococcus villosus]ENN95885.1 Magnesium chelatase [Methanocaldococcus villosus KIN24-T80]
MFGIDKNITVNPNILNLKCKSYISESRGKHIKAMAKRGRYIKYKPTSDFEDLALDASIRRAAIYQKDRKKRYKKGLAIYLEKEDLLKKVRQRKIRSYVLFVVDASGSMAAKKRMEAAKGAVLSLLLNAYQKRNKVGMIVFRNDKADLVLPFTNSVDLAEKLLKDIPTGGKTPLGKALVKAYETIIKEMKKPIIPIMVIISDFKPTVGDIKEIDKICEMIVEKGINVILIDTETSFVKVGIGDRLAKKFGFKYYNIKDITKENILEKVKL